MKKQGVLAGSLGALVLGGVLVASYGSGVAPAEAQTATTSSIIINKLNQILAAVGGIQEGNHTLRWDSNHASATRFTTAFTGAVLDNNTGLVWEQATDGTATHTWYDATLYCLKKNVGGTAGWRLPSVVELRSVLNGSSTPPLVPATVFSGVQSADYWSASTYAGDPTFGFSPTIAWFVVFGNGTVGIATKTVDDFHAWCVRGPMSESAL